MEQARHSGAHAFQPWSVQAINGAPGNWRCVVRAQDSQSVLTLEAPVFIAANGSWEPLPSDRASRPTAHRTSDLLAFKANDAGARLAHGLLPIRSFNCGYGGMVGAGEGVTTVAYCVRRDRLESLRRSLPGLSAGAAVRRFSRCSKANASACVRHWKRPPATGRGWPPGRYTRVFAWAWTTDCCALATRRAKPTPSSARG